MPDSGELHWAEAGFATMIWELLCVLFLATVLLLLFLRADGDMTLLWAHWQGRRPERELTDMVVWVTGASGGIGEELAFQLSKLGVSLVLSARRVHELERVKTRCLENGNLKEKDILVLPLDLRDRSSHEMATKVVLKEFGRIDILVNNGGIAQNSLIQDANLDVFKELIEVNYLGTVSLTKCVLPHMLERMQGKIVIVNSIAAISFTAFCSGYCASKNALQGFSNSLRVELIKYPNITISNIFLGPVKSNIFQNCLTEEVTKTSGNCAKQLPKMETSHCVQLMLIAIANDLKEVWISEHSFLLSAYVCQYMPVLSWWIFKKAQKKTVEKRLLARTQTHPQAWKTLPD